MFQSNKFSGIDFRDKKITFANIKMNKEIPVVLNIAATAVNSELLEGGRLVNHQTINPHLQSFIHNKEVSKLVHIAIPTKYTILRKLDSLPDLGELELSRLLHFQIGESIHLPFDEPVYDFVKIGSIHPKKASNKDGESGSLDSFAVAAEEDMKGSRSEILFFATSKLLAEDLSNACSKAGFKPKTAEIRGLALQRLLSYAHPSWLTGTEIVIDVSEESIDLHIFKDELIIFTRTIQMNHNQYLNAPRAPLVNDEQTLVLEDAKDQLSFSDNDDQLTLTEIETDYDEVAVTKVKEIPGKTNNKNLKSFDEESYVSDLVNEIERAQNFFRYSLGERDSEFKRIIVTGECTDRVFEPLTERITTQICRIDYSSVISPRFMQWQLLDTCSVAIGIAMRGNEKVVKKWKK